MEAVAEVVLRKIVLHAVNGEAALVDAVCVASDGCAEIALIVLRVIVLYIVEAQDHVAPYPVLVFKNYGCDASAEIGDSDFHSVTVSQGVDSVALFLGRRTSKRSQDEEAQRDRDNFIHKAQLIS